MGYKRGQSFSILHSQNITKRWNAAISFRRVNSLGQYSYQQQLMNDFHVTSHFRSKNDAYAGRIFINLALNPSQQNGGIVSDTAFGEINQGDRAVEPIRYQADARSRRRTFFLDHQLRIVQIGADTAGNNGWGLGLYNHLEYSKDLLAFVSDTSSYLPTPRFTLATADSTSLQQVEASGGVFIQKGGLTLQGGGGWMHQRHGGFYVEENARQVFTEAKALFVHQQWAFRGLFRQSLGGSALPGATLLEAEARFTWKDWQLSGEYRFQNRTPDWFFRYSNTNLTQWDNRFSFENLSQTRISGALSHPRWGLVRASTFATSGYTYLDEAELPRQYGSSLAVLQLQYASVYRLVGGLHLATDLAYQVSGQQDILPLPEWVVRGQLYYHINFFKEALKTQFGVQANYFSAYRAPIYVPYLDQFALQSERAVGNYPILTAFAGLKIDDFTFYAFAEHFNRGWMGYDYFVTPQYPLPDLNLRVALSWRFFD